MSASSERARTSLSPERGSRRERFLPHAFVRGGLQCTLDDLRIEGQSVTEAIEPELHRITLASEPWERLELEGRIDLPQATLNAVLPEGDRDRPPVAIWLVQRCAATRCREGLLVASMPCRPGVHRFQLRLDRNRLRGLVELQALLVRDRDATALQAPFATERGSRLATARAWTLRFEAPDAPPGKFLDTRYAPFSKDERLATFAASVFHLEISEAPTLWINTDHAALQPVFGDEATRGARARIRDLLFDVIAQSVWTQLFVHIADGIRRSDELVWDWEDSVLRELLPDLYPSERNHVARLERLRVDIEKEQLGALLERLTSLLQRRSAIAQHAIRLVEETVDRAAAERSG